jgi:putative transposase
MRLAGIAGCTGASSGAAHAGTPDATPSEDPVNRRFTRSEPDRLWVSDITEHSTAEGKVYVAVVLDA